MTLFYHYTDEEGAQHIIRSGKLLASLSSMATDDAGFGNGVYLTTLKPETHSKAQIAENNWVKTSAKFIKKTENYFVIDIPLSKVKDASAASANGRNIFLFGNRKDLLLHKYPWWLKNYDSGQIISSYKYTLASYGPASKLLTLGDYTITEETVNGQPVYASDHKQTNLGYLFMSSRGSWLVGKDAGKEGGWLQQKTAHSLGQGLGPDTNMPWEYGYGSGGQWHKDDATLRAYPWQM